MADTYARVMNILGSEADWASNDIVILAGEIAFATVGGNVLGKIGDGTSLWSELEYSVGMAAIPLSGTTDPVTGIIDFSSTALGKTVDIGMVEGGGVDDFQIATGGTNVSTSNVVITVNSITWKFTNSGRIAGPDITYASPADDLVMANKKYVDAAVSGGVSATYIPLVGNLGGDPVTGFIKHYDVGIDKQFQYGILNGFGVDNFVVTGAGTNAANCSMLIAMNSYNYWFMNTGRLILPTITYTSADDNAAATKAFVDALRQDCINAGLAIPAVV